MTPEESALVAEASALLRRTNPSAYRMFGRRINYWDQQ
jgi:hypothetical protein